MDGNKYDYDALLAPESRITKLEAENARLRKVAEAAKAYVRAETRARTTPTYFFQLITEMQEALAALRQAVEGKGSG